MTTPRIAFGQQPCGFFPRRFLFAKIATARRLQAELGGEIVFFFHDSDHDPRETQTLLRSLRTGELARLNFSFANKIQRKWSPLFLKRLAPGWRDGTARQLPACVAGRWVEAFRQVAADNAADFCLEMYRRMGLLEGIRVVRSGDPGVRRAACDIADFFVDVPYENEIVRARSINGSLQLHEGGDCYVTVPPAAFGKEQISPARDARLRWMQSVLQCTHYVAGAGEQGYLKREDAPEITFVNRDPIDRSDEAYTDLPAYGRPLRIGLTCYPSVGGSGILASALGEELARRGHEVHFISYERPFRLPDRAPRLHFHPVVINDYGLFKYPDYTLPLSVKMAEVAREHRLDILHVHYAVPHATAAILAQSMLPPELRPRLVTTLHGTDTTLLGRDAGYGPAIRHALTCSDAVTTVSAYLERETRRLLAIDRPIDVIPNFFTPRAPRLSRAQVRRDLGVGDEALIVHASNLRPLKRIDLLLETAAQIRPREAFKLLILAGDDFAPFAGEVRRLGLADRVIVRERVAEIEDYLQAADLGLFTSEVESFCLSILEAMCFACPSVAPAVGGIPEVVESGVTGLLVPFGDPSVQARAVESLLRDPKKRAALGRAAQRVASKTFSAAAVVPLYEELYRRVVTSGR